MAEASRLPRATDNRGTAAGPALQPAGPRGAPFRPDRTPRGRRPRIKPVLLLLLVASLAFLGGVQLYLAFATGDGSAADPSTNRSGLGPIPVLWTQSPAEVAHAGVLRLAWEPYPTADGYLLTIRGADGRIVVENLPVEASFWDPPYAVLPGLPAGDYLWEVTAVGEGRSAVARSSPCQLRILG